MNNEIRLTVEEQDARILENMRKERAKMKIEFGQLEAMANEQERIVDEMEAELRAKHPTKVTELAELELLKEELRAIKARVREIGAEMDERDSI